MSTDSITYPNQNQVNLIHDTYLEWIDSEKKLFHFIVDMDSITGSVFATQSWLGEQCNRGREWTNRTIAKFKRQGALLVISQGYKRTNILKPTKSFLAMGMALTLSLNFLAAKPVQQINVTQLILDVRYIKKQQSTVNSQQSVVLRRDAEKTVEPVGAVETVDFFKKERNKVLTYEQKNFITEKIVAGEEVNPFCPTLDNIPKIELTTAGKADLSEFPEEALLHAVGLLKRTGGIDNPFAYVRAVALKYCKERGIQCDWGWKKKLKELYGIKQGDICFKDKSATRSNERGASATENNIISASRSANALTAHASADDSHQEKKYRYVHSPYACSSCYPFNVIEGRHSKSDHYGRR